MVPRIINLVKTELKTNPIVLKYRALLENDPGNTELERIVALLTIGYFFPTVIRKKNSYNESQKPSKIEIQNAFVKHFPTVTSLKLHSQDLNQISLSKRDVERLHPVGFILGDLSNPSDLIFLIKILDEEIPFQGNIWEGLDTLFKLFFGYQSFYPTAAEHVWLFWQNEVYKIKTEDDAKLISSSYIGFLKEYKFKLTGEEVPNDIRLPVPQKKPGKKAAKSKP